jgi:hypothetical protein
MTNLPAERHSQIDTKKWHLNATTGEYHRIQRQHAGGIITDAWTYGQRAFYYHEQRRDLSIRLAVMAAVMIGLFFLHLYCESQSGALSTIFEFLFPYLLIFCVVAAIIISIYLFYVLLTKESSIGPPPIPQPGREQVEQQKVHGDGRLMTREEMDWALRGESGPVQVQTFED